MNLLNQINQVFTVDAKAETTCNTNYAF